MASSAASVLLNYYTVAALLLTEKLALFSSFIKMSKGVCGTSENKNKQISFKEYALIPHLF